MVMCTSNKIVRYSDRSIIQMAVIQIPTRPKNIDKGREDTASYLWNKK